MSQQTYSNQMLSIAPPQPCTMHTDCKELASFAIIGEIEFSPHCIRHGYAWGCGTQAEYASITRFVLSEFDNLGTARVVMECSPHDAPGYEQQHLDDSGPDSAWVVAHDDGAGKVKTVWCVWCAHCLEFYMHESED